jgi:hypothetical protein
MTDRKKFEQMLELLINEETEKAKELFHDIVVEKSREIYESLLESDFEQEETTEGMDEEPTEGMDEEPYEAADDEEGGDEPDMGGDEESPDMAGDEEDMSDEEQTDRILDLEDALEELKAEFEELMAGGGMDDEGDEMGDLGGDATDDFMADIEDDPKMDEFAFEEADEDLEEEADEDLEEEMDDDSVEESMIREYVEKVATAKMGDDGANTKSIVAGKNDMGGTTANIVKGADGGKGGTQGGLANPSTKEDNAGNVNVPGAKAATKLKSVPKGHGAEKKGTGDNGANTKSLIGSRK